MLELFRFVHKYLSGEVNLAELEEWLVPRLPSLFALPPSATNALELVGKIELGLAEMGLGIRSEPEFQEILRESCRVIRISYPEMDSGTQTGCSDRLSEAAWEVSSR